MEAIARLTAHANAPSLALVGALGLSAGIHVALFAAHVRELPLLSASYLLAAGTLALAALVVSFRPGRLARVAAGALALALLVAYPFFSHEPLDAVAVVSKTAEAVALLLAANARLVRSDEPGTPVGVLTLAVAVGLFLAGGHGH